jgi:hypothetical protein
MWHIIASSMDIPLWATTMLYWMGYFWLDKLFQKLMNMRFHIMIVNIMMGAFYSVQRNQEAKDLFAAIPANG